MNIKHLSQTVAIFATALLATGCSAPKNVSYFQDETSEIINIANSAPIRVKPEDKLNILVKSKDPALSDLFNLGIFSNRYGTSNSTSMTGAQTRSYSPGQNDGVANYTVDPQGDIDFPILGKLHVAGMTRAELSGFIKGELMGRDLVKDPVVTVEFVNTGINILGEVRAPGRYDMNVDNMSLVEALALAGDLTINGKRENVKVLREENGQVRIYTLDMTRMKDLAASPAYFLQQGDVVYVEPNEMRKRQTTVNGNNVYNVSFWLSVASLLTSAVTTVGVFVK